MAAVNHVKAILDALEIRVLSREDGVVLLVAVGIERLAEIPDVPRIPRIFRVIQKTRNIPLDGLHVEILSYWISMLSAVAPMRLSWMADGDCFSMASR